MNNELYLFNDSGTIFAFTPAIFSRTFNGIEYKPTIVTRSNVNLTDNFAKSPISFKFIRTNTFALGILRNIPETPITAQIFRNELPYWEGKVIFVKANPGFIEVGCDSIFTTVQKIGLPSRISLMCRHTLYDPYTCKAIMENFIQTFDVEGIVGPAFVYDTGKPDGYFNGGIAEINAQKRTIVEQVGSQFTVHKAFNGPQTGVLKLYPGCNLTEATCNDKFMNLPNYGGFSHMPTRNPFSNAGAL